MQKILIIQTAFLGDVILATSLIEKLHGYYPDAKIDFLLRKGNEQILTGHPFIDNLYVFDKKKKYKELIRIIKAIRKIKYDYVINVQRFFTTGLITVLSSAKVTVGFDKNPLSKYFRRKVSHNMTGEEGQHEVERNHQLIEFFTDCKVVKPRLYPLDRHIQKVSAYTSNEKPYITIAPASVWFTKQFPKSKWIEFIDSLPDEYAIYLVGGPADADLCNEMITESQNSSVTNLAGLLNILETAVLMKSAAMNYVNDSGPQHIASASNAPVCAVFCSTVLSFGYGPLSDESYVIEAESELPCKPCGLHGKRTCPEGHFKCAYDIKVAQLLSPLSRKN